MLRLFLGLFTVLYALILLLFSSLGWSDVVEKVDGVEINYSQMKVRFVGQSAWVKEDGQIFRPAEQRAWSDGIAKASQKMPKILADRSGAPESAIWKAADFQPKETASVKTIFAGDDTVTVLLENYFDRSAGKANQAAAGDKALVISLASSISPRFNYDIVDESGSTLSKSSTENDAGLQKIFKNRWFRRNETQALANFKAGEKPQVSGRYAANGKVTLNQADWNEAVSKLGGEPDRIIFIVP